MRSTPGRSRARSYQSGCNLDPFRARIVKMASLMEVQKPGVRTQKALIGSAGVALAILAFINLSNYLDRYLVAALVEPLKHSELALSDAQLGSLMSGFIIV